MGKIISKINGQNIQIIESGSEKLVPIKPIRQALGLSFRPQNVKIKCENFYLQLQRLALQLVMTENNAIWFAFH